MKEGSPRRKAKEAEATIVFDAKLVARKDEGWDVMLERALNLWVEVVVAEKRGDR